MTHEMQPTPRTTVVLRKLRAGRTDISCSKKVTKTVVVVAELTCIVHLCVSPGVPAAPGPRAALSCRARSPARRAEQLKDSS